MKNGEFIGAVVSFYVTLLSGELKGRVGVQMSQSGNVMELPYLRFGLGRTNNYISNLIVKTPVETDRNDSKLT